MNTDKPDEAPLPLDGNAAGGLLRDLFVFDVTSASVVCDECGSTARVAEAKLYGGQMGAIFRCAHCSAIVMRLVRTPAGFWLDMRGARSLLVRPGTTVAA